VACCQRRSAHRRCHPRFGVAPHETVRHQLHRRPEPDPSHADPGRRDGRYYEINVAAREPGRIPGPVGCAVTKPLATRQLTGGVFEAFVQMYCAQCPVVSSTQPQIQTSEEIPVAFRLQGSRVESVEAADATGGPPWFDQIRKYFPHQLRGAAANQELSQQQAASALTQADRAAGCPHP
jgi:hypothetical protein